MKPDPALLSHWFDARLAEQARVSSLGDGHIHDTYLLEIADENYVLQRVNTTVFRDPHLVMRQTAVILERLSQLKQYVVPELVNNNDGQSGMWVDDEYWRVWRQIEHSTVVDPIQDTAQACAAGAAFGDFQRVMQGVDLASFEDPIEGFLQLDFYLEQFELVASSAPSNLRALVDQHRHLATQLGARNALIHGDCKVNNLLFDARGQQVLAIIDFDTSMAGHWAWDYGDLVRSVCFSRGSVEIEFVGACLEGFARSQPMADVEACMAAPAYVSLMLGIRFLTDHLNGDTYFRVAEHGQNLQRASQQFDLLNEFIQQQDPLRGITERVLGQNE